MKRLVFRPTNDESEWKEGPGTGDRVTRQLRVLETGVSICLKQHDGRSSLLLAAVKLDLRSYRYNLIWTIPAKGHACFLFLFLSILRFVPHLKAKSY